MDDCSCFKEIELAKRGVDAFVDRANELHHQGRYSEALKQLEVSRICHAPSNTHSTSVLEKFAKESLGRCIIAR